MPRFSSPTSASTTHKTIALDIPDLTVNEAMVLQDIIETELPGIETSISSQKEAVTITISGFQYQVLWAGYLMGQALSRRATLETLV